MEEERDESIATVLRLRLGWIVFKEDRQRWIGRDKSSERRECFRLYGHRVKAKKMMVLSGASCGYTNGGLAFVFLGPEFTRFCTINKHPWDLLFDTLLLCFHLCSDH